MERRKQQIGTYREYVANIQKKRAQQMLTATDKRFGSVNVGTTVRIPIDPVDRGKTDPRNVLGIVMENSNGYYTIGTEHGLNNLVMKNCKKLFFGLLPHKFVRSSFAVAGASQLTPPAAPPAPAPCAAQATAGGGIPGTPTNSPKAGGGER